LHVFDKERPGQSRGVPDLAAIIEPLKQLGRYTDAEITAAVVAGMFTVFVKSQHSTNLQPMQPTGQSGASEGDEDYKLMSGGIVGLLPGEDVIAPNPGRPNDAFDPFVQAIMVQIGMALELPYELLVKRFTSSYSAARAAVNEAWKYFVTMRSLIADTWCQPVYEAVIEEAVLKGRIAAPGFLQDPAIRRAYLGATWIGPGRGQINEVQEVEAAVMRIDNSLSTKSQETAALNGGDYEANVRTRRREIEAEEDIAPKPKDDPDAGGGDEDEDDPDKPENDDPQEPRPPPPDTSAAVIGAALAGLKEAVMSIPQPHIDMHMNFADATFPVTVNVPPAEPPVITVNVPPPTMQVAAPDVVVHLELPPRKLERIPIRDKESGLITKIVEQEIEK
jgi:capsid protein